MAKKKISSDSDARFPRIFTVRKLPVVFDADVAGLYGVPTHRLNEAIKRNAERFPEDFCFTLTHEEVATLRSQIAISNGRGGRRYLPRVFTEHGALMAATVLNSKKAVQMSLYLVRAFVKMREEMFASTHIFKRLAEIDRRLVEHDSVLREIITQLQPLLDAPAVDDSKKPRIGFHRGNR